MAGILIVLVSVLAAVLYGEVHDQITIRICPEYFTVAHPQVSDTTSLTVLACIWGFMATWWVGVALGIPLALCARSGSRPPCPPQRLLRPMAAMLLVTAVCACSSGLIGLALFQRGRLMPDPYWVSVIPSKHLSGFVFDAWTHQASYLCGCLAGIGLMVWVWLLRRAGAGTAPASSTRRR